MKKTKFKIKSNDWWVGELAYCIVNAILSILFG